MIILKEKKHSVKEASSAEILDVSQFIANYASPSRKVFDIRIQPYKDMLTLYVEMDKAQLFFRGGYLYFRKTSKDCITVAGHIVDFVMVNADGKQVKMNFRNGCILLFTMA